MISTDRKVFDPKSAVHQRMIEYGQLVDELHIVVLTARSHGISRGKVAASKNVFLYGTNALSRWTYVFTAIRMALRITKDWGRENALITTQDPFETAFVGVMVKIYRRIPILMQLHTDMFGPGFMRATPLNIIRRALVWIPLAITDCVRVVSRRIQDNLLDSWVPVSAEQIHVLPIFVDLEKIRHAAPDFNLRTTYPYIDPIILVVSRLAPEKNIDRLIDAFARVHRRYPSAGLLIVGDGDERDRLKRYVQKKGLELFVQFAGWQEDLVPYYRGADVYLHAAADFEGYGRTLLEAAAAGCPIVTPDVGIAGEVFSASEARIVEHYTSANLADQLEWVLEHKEEAEVMADNAKKTALSSAYSDKRAYLDAIEELWKKC